MGRCIDSSNVAQQVSVQVQELELNADMKSVDNLLTFLEKVFNGGSDFKCAQYLSLSRA